MMREMWARINCKKKECMNNKIGYCQLLEQEIKDKECPFYKTDIDNDMECMELGVLTWHQMIRRKRQY